MQSTDILQMPKIIGIPDRLQIDGMINKARSNPGQVVVQSFVDELDECKFVIVYDAKDARCMCTLYVNSTNGKQHNWSFSTEDADCIVQALGNRSAKMLEFQGKQYKSNDNNDVDLEETWRVHVKTALEGELETIQITNVLQSISLSKLTGKLEIRNGLDSAIVFFVDGKPKHCTIKDAEGDSAMIELVSWSEGTFRFHATQTCDRVTVTKTLPVLLMEGAALQDRSNFLEHSGLSSNSYLVKNHSHMTEYLFEQLIACGINVNSDLQKTLYKLIDNKSTLTQLLKKRPMPKAEWVPTLYNLVTCGLICFRDELIGEGELDAFDWSTVREFEKSLFIPNTHVCTYPAFVYFLAREFSSYKRFKNPFSLVILDVSLKAQPQSDIAIVAIPIRVAHELTRRIDRLKREVDLLGYFGESSFAILLPQTSLVSARTFSNRLFQELNSAPIDQYSLLVSLGVSSVPEECTRLEALIQKARPFPSNAEPSFKKTIR